MKNKFVTLILISLSSMHLVKGMLGEINNNNTTYLVKEENNTSKLIVKPFQSKREAPEEKTLIYRMHSKDSIDAICELKYYAYDMNAHIIDVLIYRDIPAFASEHEKKETKSEHEKKETKMEHEKKETKMENFIKKISNDDVSCLYILDTITTLRQEQNKGHARSLLLGTLKNILKNQGKAIVLVQARPIQDKNITLDQLYEFYSKLGFKKIDKTEGNKSIYMYQVLDNNLYSKPEINFSKFKLNKAIGSDIVFNYV